jgi:hypothetical protein
LAETIIRDPTILPARRPSGALTRGHLVQLGLWAILIAFGVGVALGIGWSLEVLATETRPNLFSDYLAYDDALQMYSGHWMYQDPVDGFVGLLYPPLYPALWALLLNVGVWGGWGIVISSVSSVSLACMVGALAYRRSSVPDAKALRVAEAAAFGLVGWWLVTGNPYPGSFEPRPDALSWALGLGGMLLAPTGLRGTRWALIAAVALISAGFWAKQPALAAGLAAGAWAVIAAAAGLVAWRRAVGFVAALVAVNLLVLALMNLATHGWAYFYIFTLGKRHYWGSFSYGKILLRTVQNLWLPAAFSAIVLAIGAKARLSRSPVRPSALVVDREVQQLALLALLLTILVPLETYFQRMQGGHDNHLVGQTWGLMLVAAVGWRWAGHRERSRIAVGSVVAVLAVTGLLFGRSIPPADDHGPGTFSHVPQITAVRRFPDLEPAIAALGYRGGTIYSIFGSDLGMTGDYVPASFAACGLTAAGLSPVGLERDLANRLFSAVLPFDTLASKDCSAFGKWEENYFWKLQRLVAAGYRHEPRRSAQLLFRRPEDGAAARRLLGCFAPYRLGGVLFRIGHGGGFWCQAAPSSPRLVLGDVPPNVRLSEVLTDGVVTSILGSVVITLPTGLGAVTAIATRGARAWRVAEIHGYTPGHSQRFVLTTRAPVGSMAKDGAHVLHFSAQAVREARLSFYATAFSHARLDFSGVVIHTKDGYERGAVTRRGLPRR